ncbi:hypothetical protein LTR53_003460 [Teratosphaeriaceae sp. CCFEE 6253]|nr:hypothetical protein LTR53_003460 [Teratosphaeriaceae sp. CCFEE 6253]
MPSALPPSSPFPTLQTSTKVGDGSLYDVKFYPYPTVDGDQIFAVAGAGDIFVCRPKLDADPPYEILRWFKSTTNNGGAYKGYGTGQSQDSFNSLAWARDPATRKPLLCVAGEKPTQIQILDVESGARVRSLAGHGNAINDLAVSPLSSSLLASASADYTVRLWNLEPEYAAQPCVAIFAGEGHRQHVLVSQFHHNGRWMLTAGLDTAVCLWAVPSIEELARDPELEGHQPPMTVYYPHFHSTEVHADYIDTAVFFGDLILSRASKDQNSKTVHNAILLWKIDGFASADAPPAEPPIPSPGVWTRSSFPHDRRSSRGFQRLLTFDMPSTTRFYLRFGLLHARGMRPVLAMGNEMTKFHFWDLQKLEEGYGAEERRGKVKKVRGRQPKGEAAANAVNELNIHRLGELRRGGSAASDTGVGTPDPSSTSISVPPERKYDLGDPMTPLKAHHTAVIGKTALSERKHFAMAQIAWSPDGTWMVGVGDYGMMCIFHRDESVV